MGQTPPQAKPIRSIVKNIDSWGNPLGWSGTNMRYVTITLEAHGYAARETTEHVLWEMINWFDKYVKNAPPRKSGAETER